MDVLALISQSIILLLAFGLVYTVRFAVRKMLLDSGFTPERTYQLVRRVQLGLYSWLLLLAALSLQGWFRADEGHPDRLLLILIPPLITIIWLLIDPRFYRLLRALPESWLLYGQSFRFLQDLFLYFGYSLGFVPLQMTFLWLNFDFTVGLTAPIAGYIFFGKQRFQRFEAMIWNVFGIVLLLHNFLIAFVSYPGPQQVFLRWPDSSFLADFPYSWMVGFFLPLALLMHLLSLKQLIRSERMRRRRFSLDRSKLRK